MDRARQHLASSSRATSSVSGHVWERVSMPDPVGVQARCRCCGAAGSLLQMAVSRCCSWLRGVEAIGFTTGVCFTTLGFQETGAMTSVGQRTMILTHEHTIYTPSSYDTQGFRKH